MCFGQLELMRLNRFFLLVQNACARWYFSCCQMLNVFTRGDPSDSLHKGQHACTPTTTNNPFNRRRRFSARRRRKDEEDESVITNRWSDYPATSDPAAHMNVLIKTLITDVTAGHYWDWRKLQLGEPKLAVFMKSRFFFLCATLWRDKGMCIYVHTRCNMVLTSVSPIKKQRKLSKWQTLR